MGWGAAGLAWCTMLLGMCVDRKSLHRKKHRLLAQRWARPHGAGTPPPPPPPRKPRQPAASHLFRCGRYWWNESTNAVTPVGAPKPDAWVEVRAPGGGAYFWNKQSGVRGGF
jgi:hypothetical protein